MSDLVQTPNGTYVEREVAIAAGLDVKPKPRAAAKPARKPAAKRKAATSRKGS